MAEASSSTQVSTEMKLATAKQKKESGDQAFKVGDIQGALKDYHEALMYLLGLDKSAVQHLGTAQQPPPVGEVPPKEKTEVDEIVEKIYANMSACHIIRKNWKRAEETANKALVKNENNYKAMFRKGKALGEQGFFEKALKILEDVKSKNLEDAALVDAEIARLRAIDQERERAHKQKLKGFLLKDKKPTQTQDAPTESSSSTV